ncbi:hypothetical protein PHYPSEUDO_003613 [Phytophthora pseudosyringae]|uniref:Uncharacterized protein n=1 Tax=Phytophthora pseudosyringae TaxID=221518 RepID=A0A8T1VU92_9STRA|nr:hypothetical protein PHYPSEUDO_003613 [Phytophthora pseudosyringae]
MFNAMAPPQTSTMGLTEPGAVATTSSESRAVAPSLRSVAPSQAEESPYTDGPPSSRTATVVNSQLSVRQYFMVDLVCCSGLTKCSLVLHMVTPAHRPTPQLANIEGIVLHGLLMDAADENSERLSAVFGSHFAEVTRCLMQLILSSPRRVLRDLAQELGRLQTQLKSAEAAQKIVERKAATVFMELETVELRLVRTCTENDDLKRTLEASETARITSDNQVMQMQASSVTGSSTRGIWHQAQSVLQPYLDYKGDATADRAQRALLRSMKFTVKKTLQTNQYLQQFVDDRDLDADTLLLLSRGCCIGEFDVDLLGLHPVATEIVQDLVREINSTMSAKAQALELARQVHHLRDTSSRDPAISISPPMPRTASSSSHGKRSRAVAEHPDSPRKAKRVSTSQDPSESSAPTKYRVQPKRRIQSSLRSTPKPTSVTLPKLVKVSAPRSRSASPIASAPSRLSIPLSHAPTLDFSSPASGQAADLDSEALSLPLLLERLVDPSFRLLFELVTPRRVLLVTFVASDLVVVWVAEAQPRSFDSTRSWARWSFEPSL